MCHPAESGMPVAVIQGVSVTVVVEPMPQAAPPKVEPEPRAEPLEPTHEPKPASERSVSTTAER
jgi:hypothetical protein